MTEDLVFRALVALGDGAFKTTAILFAAWLITLLIRKRAALRHRIWVVAFLVVLLVPMLGLFIPAFAVVDVSLADRYRAPLSISEQGSRAFTMTNEHGRTLSVQQTLPSRREAATTRTKQDWTPFQIAVIGLWLAGTFGLTCQKWFALLAVAELRRHSVEATHHSLDPASLSRKVGLKRSWQLLTSTTSTHFAAATWGIRRPIILLPSYSIGWTKDRLEAVLLHELAHIRRRDSLWQLVGALACTINWFNPVVWLCARAMRSEAERAADDTVVRLGIKPSAYAGHLLQFAIELGRRRQTLADIQVSLFKRSGIESRIMSLMDIRRHRGPLRLREDITAVSLGLFMIILFASFRAGVLPRIDPQQASASSSIQDDTKEQPGIVTGEKKASPGNLYPTTTPVRARKRVAILEPARASDNDLFLQLRDDERVAPRPEATAVRAEPSETEWLVPRNTRDNEEAKKLAATLDEARVKARGYDPVKHRQSNAIDAASDRAKATADRFEAQRRQSARALQ